MPISRGVSSPWLHLYILLLGVAVFCRRSVLGFAPNFPVEISRGRTSSGQGLRNGISSFTSLDSLPKDELLRLTQDYLDNPSPDYWAEDFIFRGPVIGPLVKKDIIATLETVGNDTMTAFPDLEMNVFGMTADDPIDPNRVWYFVRPRGTFLGPFRHPTMGVIQPTGASYIGPPEARSVIFNDEGKIVYQSVGYVTDRFTGDTTGGRGAVFGQYAVMGQEIDAGVGSPATILLQKLTTLLPEGMVPKSFSSPEDLPEWWTDKRMGAEA